MSHSLSVIRILFATVMFAGAFGSKASAAAGAPATNFTCEVPEPFFLGIAGPEDGFYAVTANNIYQVDNAGHLNPSFRSPFATGSFICIACRSASGDLFVGGVLGINGHIVTLAKIHADGSLYADFGAVVATNSRADFPLDAATFTGIAADENGGCFIGGSFDVINGVAADGLAHIDAVGKVTLLPRLVPHHEAPFFLAKARDGVLVVEATSAYNVTDAGDIVRFAEAKIPWTRANCATFDPAYGLAIAGQATNGVMCYVYDDAGNLKNTFEQKTIFEYGPGTLAWDSRGNLLASSARLMADVAADSNRDSYGIKRLLANGTVDPSWSRTLVFDGLQSGMVALKDSVIVSGAFTSVNSIPAAGFARLSSTTGSAGIAINQSTRGRIVGGAEQLIMGCVLRGDFTVDVLIRASSPSLQGFGVKQTVSQTRFSVYRGETLVARVLPGRALPARPYVESSVLAAVSEQVGAFPLLTNGFDEAQALLSLPPGAYTIVIDAPDGETGDVLGEIYLP